MLVVTTALVLVDIQQDYFPGGRMELHQSEAAAVTAGRLLRRFRSAGLPVVHVRHVSEESNAGFFLPDTTGIEFHPEVRPEPGELVITKHTPNSFVRTGLGGHLASIDVRTLVIAGMMTHMCVDSTTRAASDEGFECVVVSDACATCDQSFAGTTVGATLVHAAFLAALDGTFATVSTLDEVVL